MKKAGGFKIIPWNTFNKWVYYGINTKPFGSLQAPSNPSGGLYPRGVTPSPPKVCKIPTLFGAQATELFQRATFQQIPNFQLGGSKIGETFFLRGKHSPQGATSRRSYTTLRDLLVLGDLPKKSVWETQFLSPGLKAIRLNLIQGEGSPLKEGRRFKKKDCVRQRGI